MKRIITTVLCAAMAVCGTLNAQETMKENKAFAVAHHLRAEWTENFRQRLYACGL